MSDELAIYQNEQGAISLRPDFEEDTLWITQRQLAEVFDVDVRTINEHIQNIYKTAELEKDATLRNFRIVQKEGQRNVTRDIAHYNLDISISVGYRVNSAKATKFRKWATEVLRAHSSKGFTINASRLTARQANVSRAIAELQNLVQNTGSIGADDVLELVKAYAQTWLTLDRFDRAALNVTGKYENAKLDLNALEGAIATLRTELIHKGEASELFASEKQKGSLSGIALNVMQEVFGEAQYPSLEEKAAHLLYFIIKNHPFNDGNKRSGAFAFIWFLRENDFDIKQFSEPALAALTLLIAASAPSDKARMIGLILELLGYE